MVNYFKILNETFLDYKNNLRLFLPFLFGILLSFALGAIFIIEGIIIIKYFKDLFVLSPQIFQNILSNPIFIALIIIFFLIDIFLIIMLRTYVMSIVYGMNFEIVKKKITKSSIFSLGKKYFKKLFVVNLIYGLILLIPLIIFAILIALGFYLNIVLGFILLALLALIFIAYSLFLYIVFFFIGPTITSKKNDAIKLIKTSFNYFKKDIQHSLMIFLIVFLIGFIGGLVTFGLRILTEILKLLLTVSKPLLVIAIIFISILVVLQIIIRVSITIISELYVFKSYFKKK